MSTLRFHAIKETFNRPVIDVQEPQRRSAILEQTFLTMRPCVNF
jgi:hypothetical protein